MKSFILALFLTSFSIQAGGISSILFPGPLRKMMYPPEVCPFYKPGRSIAFRDGVERCELKPEFRYLQEATQNVHQIEQAIWVKEAVNIHYNKVYENNTKVYNLHRYLSQNPSPSSTTNAHETTISKIQSNLYQYAVLANRVSSIDSEFANVQPEGERIRQKDRAQKLYEAAMAALVKETPIIRHSEFGSTIWDLMTRNRWPSTNSVREMIKDALKDTYDNKTQPEVRKFLQLKSDMRTGNNVSRHIRDTDLLRTLLATTNVMKATGLNGLHNAQCTIKRRVNVSLAENVVNTTAQNILLTVATVGTSSLLTGARTLLGLRGMLSMAGILSLDALALGLSVSEWAQIRSRCRSIDAHNTTINRQLSSAELQHQDDCQRALTSSLVSTALAVGSTAGAVYRTAKIIAQTRLSRSMARVVPDTPPSQNHPPPIDVPSTPSSSTVPPPPSTTTVDSILSNRGYARRNPNAPAAHAGIHVPPPGQNPQSWVLYRGPKVANRHGWNSLNPSEQARLRSLGYGPSNMPASRMSHKTTSTYTNRSEGVQDIQKGIADNWEQIRQLQPGGEFTATVRLKRNRQVLTSRWRPDVSPPCPGLRTNGRWCFQVTSHTTREGFLKIVKNEQGQLIIQTFYPKTPNSAPAVHDFPLP